MYDHILIPVDLAHPEASSKTIQTARQMAIDYGAVLHVLTVVPPIDAFSSGFFPKGYPEQMTNAALDGLHKFTANADLESVKVQHVVAQGAIYDQILKTAKAICADLIVLASHRPALADYLLGPNAAKVVRHADCSVMVVRGN